METPEHSAVSPQDDGPPPILKTWSRLYTFVICYLLLLIALFYLFTRHFTP
jgi:hypothetical protein